MYTHDSNNQILSLITPDPSFPKSGMVRMFNRTIHSVAEEEGFLPKIDSEYKVRITDEQRIVVKIMFNRFASVVLKRVGRKHKKVIMYLHKDGVVSAETVNDKETAFHYFVGIDDCISYYINDFVPNQYKSAIVSTCVEIPYDKIIFLGNSQNMSAQLVNSSIVDSLKKSLLEFDSNNNIEVKYLDELKDETDSMIMVANGVESLGLLSLTYCKNCIWAVYPHNKNSAKLKAINSIEAQNKFCEFLVSYWEDGINGGIGK